MTQPEGSATTAWSWSGDIPLRRFLRTESGSPALLLGATILALLWANLATKFYESFWHPRSGCRGAVQPSSSASSSGTTPG